MTLTTRILNAPAIVRRTLAIAIAVVLMLVLLWLTLAAFELLRTERDGVLQKRQTLGKLDAVITLAKSIQYEGVATPIPSGAQEFLVGDREAVVRSSLQARLSSSAQKNGVVVTSAGNAPALTEENIAYIGIRANLTGPLEGVHGTVLDLESTLPVLFVREATIRAVTSSAQPLGNSPPDLFAEITFYGAMRTDVVSLVEGAKP